MVGAILSRVPPGWFFIILECNNYISLMNLMSSLPSLKNLIVIQGGRSRGELGSADS